MNVVEGLARLGAPAVGSLVGLTGSFRAFGRRILRIKSIECTDRTEGGALYQPVAPVCETPRQARDINRRPESAPPFPIRWHRMRDVWIDAHSSFVARQSGAFLQPELVSLLSARGDFSGGFCWHSGTTACVSHRVSEHLPNGIAVCGCGAFNWYHWLVEVLPKAAFAKRLPSQFADWPLIAPPEVARIPQFAESLSRAGGDRRIHIMTGGPVRVTDLVWIDSPSVSPFNLRRGWPRPAQCFAHPVALNDLPRTIMPARPRSGTHSPRRVLLVRSNSRRNYNQHEVAQMAEGLGFEPVSPELLALDEQIALFRNAEFILGPSGAAWTGLLFAQEGTRGLIWMGEQYRGFNAFANLAAIRGCDLRHFYHPLDARTTGEAYGAPYRVDVAALHDSLVDWMRA